MKVEQLAWTKNSDWHIPIVGCDKHAQMVLVFGGVDRIRDKNIHATLKQYYPSARMVYCSTAGEIKGIHVFDDSIVATAVSYKHTPLRFVSAHISDYAGSYECGHALRKQLMADDLAHILVLSDGILVNGDELVRGINEGLPPSVIVTGGLAADAGRFKETFVGLDAIPESGNIVAIGHYGKNLKVTHGSKGGWDVFGPTRIVTKSVGNILYELDGMNALELYKKYLGDRATELPGSALLFPLSLIPENGDGNLVRTILGIDEKDGSMTFAGDIPQNSRVQFMMANFDRLIDGASNAAEMSLSNMPANNPELVLMISCVGRKIVLDQRVEEEVESVTQLFDEKTCFAGFYSNGEISPVLNNVSCSLHNQTMTITAYSES